MLASIVVLAIGRPQLAPPHPTPLVGARSLSLSPDGSRIAFSYRGDVWIAPSKGGKAVPVTTNVEMDDNPIWSPDGNYIAFASNRTGNWDTFVVPADGGDSQRITYYSNSDIPTDFSPDGKQIIFRSVCEKQYNGVYGVDVNTGKISEYLVDPLTVSSPTFTPDGKTIIYDHLGFPTNRPRYHGSAAAQLWKYDVTSGTRSEVVNDGFQHLWPHPISNDRILNVTVSEVTPSTTKVGQTIPKNVDNPNRTPNVYETSLNGRSRRLTNYSGGAVRYLTTSRDGKTMAYEYDGDIFVGSVSGQASKIVVTAVQDDKVSQQERLVLHDGATSETLSPDGQNVIFSVRGEIWSLKTKKAKGPNADDATQLTKWEGTDEAPTYTPDGKAIFFVSDREGAMRLYRMDIASMKTTAITSDAADVENLSITPDKKSLAFWKVGKQGGLYTVPVDGGVAKQVLGIPSSQSRVYAFSPDMKFVAIEEPLLRSGYYYWQNSQNIRVYEVATGTSHDVTQLSASHSSPAWSADGRYIYCVSDRDGEGIYAIPLHQEDAKAESLELKYEAPKTAPVIDIDFEGIETRVRKLTAASGATGLDVDATTGDLYFVSQGDLWTTSYAGENTKKITNGGGINGFNWNLDGKGLNFIRNGVPSTLDVRNPQFPVTAITFRADWTRDVSKERQAAFEQFWRAYNRGFYDPNFHGRDWAEIKKRYQKLLPSVGHRNEFATVLNFMVGELESSHSEVGPAPGNPRSEQTAAFGVDYDYSYQGSGIRIAKVYPKSPGSFAKTKLGPGDVIESINGIPASLTESFFGQVLNQQNGRDITLKVRGSVGLSREVKIRALSSGESTAFAAEDKFEHRRQLVDQLSGGRLAYVHIAGMGDAELRRFNLEVWQRSQGKQGLIIDVRENGGGNTGDRIIDVLERSPNSYYAPRDEAPFLGPGQALGFPMVVMANETSYSNAEMFPAAMKSRKLATLVGMPTPGYVIYTYGLDLVDGTVARMPQTGTWKLNGEPLENNGVVPDIQVPWSSEQMLKGDDVQLAAAVKALLR